MFKNYFKTAWRSIWKNRKITFINVAGLSVGMTAALLIFLWVQNETNFDNYHKDSNRIYGLTESQKSYGYVWDAVPLLLAEALKSDVPEIEKTARMRSFVWPIFNINNHLTYEKDCVFVDDDWFKIFDYHFVEGDAAAFFNDPNSIILTESKAKKLFGNSIALGKTIHADSMNYTVKGIVADAPPNSSFQYGAFIPLANLLRDADRKANDEDWGNTNYMTFIKLKPGININAVSKKITSVLQQRSGDTEKQTSISLISLSDLHFETDVQSAVFGTGNKSTVYIFSLLGTLLLVIACINYVNLTTAKASLRAKEVSVRKIIGANRLHLFIQFLAETLLVSCIALAVTLVLVHFCLPAFNLVTNKNFELPLSSALLWRLMGFSLLASFVLNSIYPALVFSSFNPLEVFKGITVLKLKDSFLRKGLVTLQFTISVALIVGTIVIYKQMKFTQTMNPGYNKSQVLITQIPQNINNNKKLEIELSIKQSLLSQSCIQSVSLANQTIVNIGSSTAGGADWDGHDVTFNPKLAWLSTDADYATTMQLQMMEGRWFRPNDAADYHNVVLNEAAVKELNIHQPYTGQRFTWKGKAGQIIGVVKDFKYKSLHDKTGSLVICQDPDWYNTFMIRIGKGGSSQAIASLEKTWRKILPGSPVEYSFLDDAFDELYKDDQRTSSLILIFSVLAVTISCLGLFGLSAFTAERRAKEIGTRKVLGASVGSIVTMLSADFLKLVILALIIASPIAFYFMTKWLESFAYRIDITWNIFLLAGSIAILIAVITISFQSVKAALANPVKSLRTE